MVLHSKLNYSSKRHERRIDSIASGYYSENICRSSLLLRLLCWEMSVASHYAGSPITQGRTLPILILFSESLNLSSIATGVMPIIIYSRSLPDGTVGLAEGRDERLCWAGSFWPAPSLVALQ